MAIVWRASDGPRSRNDGARPDRADLVPELRGNLVGNYLRGDVMSRMDQDPDYDADEPDYDPDERDPAPPTGDRATMNAEFNGKVYPHPMVAERQREIWVSVTALQMMQKHHGNPYFSFRCVPSAEEAEWLRKADALAPPVRIETDQ